MNDKTPQVTFRAFPVRQWPVMSKHVRKFHEHTRCRGFTPEEIAFFKDKGRWKNGAYVERGDFFGPLTGPMAGPTAVSA